MGNSGLDYARWPKGPGNVSSVFNPNWPQLNSATALYAPCDRAAMPGHEGWKEQFPCVWWQPEFTIVVYLEFIHSILNKKRYAGQEVLGPLQDPESSRAQTQNPALRH